MSQKIIRFARTAKQRRRQFDRLNRYLDEELPKHPGLGEQIKFGTRLISEAEQQCMQALNGDLDGIDQYDADTQ